MNSKGITTIPGFKMFSLGPYPAVVKTDNIEDSIVVEVMEVSTQTKHAIDMMEFGAGYYEEMITVIVDNQNYNCSIYTFDEIPNNNEVPDGDWSKYQGISQRV